MASSTGRFQMFFFVPCLLRDSENEKILFRFFPFFFFIFFSFISEYWVLRGRPYSSRICTECTTPKYIILQALSTRECLKICSKDQNSPTCESDRLASFLTLSWLPFSRLFDPCGTCRYMSDKQSSIRAAIRQLQTKMLFISYAYGAKEKRKLIGISTTAIKSITSPVIAIINPKLIISRALF